VTARVVVVGGGITGLAAAERLVGADAADLHVEVVEASHMVGGKLRSSAFAGRPRVDEGADAYLTRVPHADALASRVGLAASLTAPAAGAPFVWHDGLHPIPDGVLLGVPGDLLSLARGGLLSSRGIARAALEPLLPRRPDGDSVGRLVRARFGREVHERLVDALVGSIYATDTDRFSLAMVPQLADLAGRHRSLLLGARAMRASRPVPVGPVFAAPLEGMGSLADATARRAVALGALVSTGHPAATVTADGHRWRVDDGEPVDAVVVATPAGSTAALVATAAPDLARLLAASDRADVAIVTMALHDWPDRLREHSGYLVPKPDQRLVTAVSFASQKWAHWRDGDELLRVSLGRDGLPIAGVDDDALIAAAVDEVGCHLGLDVRPTAVRLTRWPAAFPQYRPGHRDWLAALDAATPPGLHLAGASYRGIGVPACIADGERAAVAVLAELDRRSR
jgi:protoporphyrinogen/coproporphyrinogen III oxidase